MQHPGGIYELQCARIRTHAHTCAHVRTHTPEIVYIKAKTWCMDLQHSFILHLQQGLQPVVVKLHYLRNYAVVNPQPVLS